MIDQKVLMRLIEWLRLNTGWKKQRSIKLTLIN